MKLVQEHLDRLCCPVCFGALRLRLVAGGEAIDCLACGRRYPVHDGLPVLIESRAVLMPASAARSTEGAVQGEE